MDFKTYTLVFILIYTIINTIYFFYAIFRKIISKDKNVLNKEKRKEGSYELISKSFIAILCLNLITYFSKNLFICNSMYFTIILTSILFSTILSYHSFYIIDRLIEKL